MATLYGLRITRLKNLPLLERDTEEYTYKEIITFLTTDVVKRLRQFQNGDRECYAVQLLFPLTGWCPSVDVVDGTSYNTLGKLINLIQTSCGLLARQLNVRYPLVGAANAIVNSLVITQLVDCAIRHESTAALIEHLFDDNGQISSLTVHATTWDEVKLSKNMTVRRRVVECVAGLKYWLFRNVKGAKSFETWGKDYPGYANVHFFDDSAGKQAAIRHIGNDVHIFQHFDNPTYAPHLYVPLEGNYSRDMYTDSFSTLVQMECVVDQARANSNSGLKMVSRRFIEVMKCIQRPMGETGVSILSKLDEIGTVLANGGQFELATLDLSRREVIHSMIDTISDTPNSSRAIPFDATRLVIFLDTAYTGPMPSTDFNVSTYEFGFSLIGSVSGKAFSRPIRYSPNYKDDLGDLHDVRELLRTFVKRKDDVTISNIWDGLPLVDFAKFGNAAATPVDPRLRKEFPNDYFDREQSINRMLFRGYRKTIDRSWAKDQAVLETIFSIAGNWLTANKSYTAAYFGASGIHPNDDQPLVIDPWSKGTIFGVPAPSSKVSQYGYDVSNGVITDLTRPSPSGTFSFIYCDVDQVQDAGDDLGVCYQIVRSLFDTINDALTTGGSFVMKINFPTRQIMDYLVEVVAPKFTDGVLIKPVVSNNLELFVGFFCKVDNRGCHWNSDCSRFMFRLHNRYNHLDHACDYIPIIGNAREHPRAISRQEFAIRNPTSSSDTLSQEIELSLGLFSQQCAANTITISRNLLHGMTEILVSGVVTASSLNRCERLDYSPTIDSTTILHQHREIATASPQLFQFEASEWTLLAMGYNELAARFVNGSAKSLVDVGSGPEGRSINYVDSDIKVTLFDQRTPHINVDWFANVEYIQGDYLQRRDWRGCTFDTAICIFSFGAATAGSPTGMIEYLTELLEILKDAGCTRIIIQLNCPLMTKPTGVVSKLEIDVINDDYYFIKQGRVEPYASPQDILGAITQALPQSTVQIKTLDDELSWFPRIISEGFRVTTEAMRDAITLSKLLPLFLIETSKTLFRPAKYIGLVDEVITATWTVTDPFVDVSVYLEDTSVGFFNTIDNKIIGVEVKAVFDGRGTYRGTFSTDKAGVVTFEQTEQDGTSTILGSFLCVTGPNAVAITWPANEVVGDNPNVASLTNNTGYELIVAYEYDGTWIGVNAYKANVYEDAAGDDKMEYYHVVGEEKLAWALVDHHYGSPGARVVIPFVWPDVTALPGDVLVAPPYAGDWLVNVDGNLTAELHVDEPDETPALWTLMTRSVANNGSSLSYIGQAGIYTFLKLP
uniref:Lambda 2 n=1 Tax=Piscine orthoreovirus TaxID=1157337 RepID=A0A4P9D3U8_9REOV|nr:lambda 2 [Piscine orthoreovirus]